MTGGSSDAKWLAEKIPNAWRDVRDEVEGLEWFGKLASEIRLAYATSTVFPAEENIFKALELSPDDVRVVILGRDPYPQKDYACGLAFSAPNAKGDPPKTIQGIIRELDLEGLSRPLSNPYDLSRWAKQGVLLLNITLTIGGGVTGRHEGYGWAYLTSRILRYLDAKSDCPPVFLLWGGHAKKKECHLKRAAKQNRVLKAAHPSYGKFLGCGHFNSANNLIERDGHGKINW